MVPTLESIDPLAYEGAEPTASVSDAGSDGWYGADAALTLTGGAGVKRLQYRIGDGAWTTYDAPVPLEAGSYAVDYRAQGNNLQWSEVRSRAGQGGRRAPDRDRAARRPHGDGHRDRRRLRGRAWWSTASTAAGG